MTHTKTGLMIGTAIIIIIGTAVYYEQSKPVTDKTTKTPTQSQSSHTTAKPAFNKTQYSTTDPTSLWVVVNKVRPLQPLTYVPNDLVTPKLPLRVPGSETMSLRLTTAQALEQLYTAAKQVGLSLMLSSGYRSYAYQANLHSGYVKTIGQAEADQLSARPGYSEHQTGLAVDIEPLSRNCELNVCFANTPEGKWLTANAYSYGFIIRYPADKVAITGYQYEPWHIRFIGIPLASEMHKQGVETLEEFFDLLGGNSY